jgi:hypothetical protein
MGTPELLSRATTQGVGFLKQGRPLVSQPLPVEALVQAQPEEGVQADDGCLLGTFCNLHPVGSVLVGR